MKSIERLELFNGHWAKVKSCRFLSSPRRARRALHEGIPRLLRGRVLQTLMYDDECPAPQVELILTLLPDSAIKLSVRNIVVYWCYLQSIRKIESRIFPSLCGNDALSVFAKCRLRQPTETFLQSFFRDPLGIESTNQPKKAFEPRMNTDQQRLTLTFRNTFWVNSRSGATRVLSVFIRANLWLKAFLKQPLNFNNLNNIPKTDTRTQINDIFDNIDTNDQNDKND